MLLSNSKEFTYTERLAVKGKVYLHLKDDNVFYRSLADFFARLYFFQNLFS